jgi:exopolysaccharide biosynthesis predicted pyruvyltransferase EpsI
MSLCGFVVFALAAAYVANVFNYTLLRPLPIEVPSDRYHVVHSVLTRFMVGQPNQTTLAKARLKLFKTFCYPTMTHQTSQNYHWIVLVDPGLDGSVVREMESLLTLSSPALDNVYMVMTNNMAWMQDGTTKDRISASYGVSLYTIAMEHDRGNLNIVTGNKDNLRRTLDGYNNRKNRDNLIVIETLLDADDGMHYEGIERIQELAVKYTTAAHHQQKKQERERRRRERRGLDRHHTTESKSTSPLPSSSSLVRDWWILCGTDHIEWHNRDVYNLTSHEYKKVGIASGVVGVRTKPKECISAGYTRVGLVTESMTTTTTHPNTTKNNKEDNKVAYYDFPSEASQNHYRATLVYPRCTTEVVTHCHRRCFEDKPLVMRSRTITSDGMKHLDPKAEVKHDNMVTDRPPRESAFKTSEGELVWKLLRRDFFIDRDEAHKTSVFLFKHRVDILADNDKGRCVAGFPCNERATKILESLKATVAINSGSDKLDAKKALRIKTKGITQPTVLRLYDTQSESIKKRHQCIEAIRDRHNHIADLLKSSLPQATEHGSSTYHHKVILVDPAYHASVADHMLTLGALVFLRGLGVHPSEEVIQCGPSYQRTVERCDRLKWWTDPNVERLPALSHAGGNWGDLWPKHHKLRNQLIQKYAERNLLLIVMPQSLYYANKDLEMEESMAIEESLMPSGNNSQNASKSTNIYLLWREHFSLNEAKRLYPHATNILMPDIAFQLGPYEAQPLSPSDPRSVDIVFFLRDDKESVDCTGRDPLIIRNMLTALGGAEGEKSTFVVVDWNDRLKMFNSSSYLFTDTAIMMLSAGRVVICDRLHAAILSYLSGIPFIFIDQLTGKISKTLSVALASAEGCSDGSVGKFARAITMTQAIELALAFLESGSFRPDAATTTNWTNAL